MQPIIGEARRRLVQDQVVPRLVKTVTMLTLEKEGLYKYFTAWQVKPAGL
jgi:hypothetical protein